MNLVEVVREAGIVGAGGAGFPTHVKLNTQAEWFIVNAAECEPLIETDKYLCRTYAEQIVIAIRAVAAHLGANHAVIALKRKYQAEIAALQDAIAKAGGGIEICQMDTFYPAGDEQTMVQIVTGQTVPERGLPIDVGAVVDNVGTLLHIYDAITQQTGVYKKFLSVTGAVQEPMMLHVPIGTAITECLAQVSLTTQNYAIILGGPMMGRVLADPEQIAQAVVTKTTGNILVLPHDHYLVKRASRSIERIRVQAKSACIQCRMCTDLCPRYLIGHQIRPHLVMRNLYRESSLVDDAAFTKAFGDAANCCSCGVCEMFACPMGLSPRKVNEYIKGRLRERNIQVPRHTDCAAKAGIDQHRIPTERLIARLDLSKYAQAHAHTCMELTPEQVYIPFAQHIGKPAIAVKEVGDQVQAGELLAQAAEGLSANIHASLTGVITEISTAGARIVGRKEG